MQNVLIAMMMIVSDRTFWRPNLSPIAPKNTPPSGRTRKGTENVANAAIVWTDGDVVRFVRSAGLTDMEIRAWIRGLAPVADCSP